MVHVNYQLFMFNYIKKKNKQELTIVLLLYATFLLISIIAYDDFGISVDEWELRILGFANLKYLIGLFSLNKANELNNIMPIPDLSDYLGTHGAIFALPMSIIEYIFDIKDSQTYYFLRHYINHIVFLFGSFYLYLLVKQRFNNWTYGILAVLFLILSPRIFAESFYNHKDVIFLSFFIINLYYGIKFFKKNSLLNASFFALTTALSIDIRIMGIVIIPCIIVPIILKNQNKIRKILLSLTLYVLLLFLFTILFWPYLWDSPLINFIKVFQKLSSFPHSGYNFYMGEYILASYSPWHYIPVWMLITTPPLYILLFLFGLIYFVIDALKYVNSKNIWNENFFIEDIIYLALLFIPIIMVIALNSTLYNGWRHLYFVYPCLLIFSVRGIHYLRLTFFSKKKWVIEILTIIFLAQISFDMIKNHPFQNVYFNFFAGDNVEKKFEIDYWGLSNKQAFEYILEKEKTSKINIGSAGPISLENSKMILDSKDRNRINITKNSEADYIIDNYINWHGRLKKEKYQIPRSFKIDKNIIVSGKKISSIYKSTK